MPKPTPSSDLPKHPNGGASGLPDVLLQTQLKGLQSLSSSGQGLRALETENASLKAELAGLKRQLDLHKALNQRASHQDKLLDRNEDQTEGQTEGIREGHTEALLALSQTLPNPVYLIEVDADRNLLDNGRLDALLGYAPGSLDRLRRAALVHPEDRGIRQQVLVALSAADAPSVQHSVMRLRHRLGEWRRFDFYDRVLERHEDGRPKLLIGCAECREASALQAEQRAEALEQERHTMRQVLAALPQASVLQFDADGRIELVEGDDLQAIGGNAEALLGRKVGSAGLPGHCGRIPEDRYRRCLRGERQQLEMHAGEKVYVLSLIPLWAEAPGPESLLRAIGAGQMPKRRVVGGMQVLQDISTHVRPQEQLEKQLMELAEDNENLRQCLIESQELERSVLSAAHDLKQPIRSIHSFAQLLERRLVLEIKKQHPEEEAPMLSADLQDCLTYIRQGSKRMETMMDGIMAFGEAKRQTGQERPISVEPFALDECLEGVLQGLAQQIGEKQVQVIYSDLPTIEGNPMDIGKLLQNLVSNAIKFNDKAHPEVVVEALNEGQHWHLSVADNGIGMPEAEEAKVFGLFERLHSKDEYEGAGIGLALCRKIVERHGGTIWFESNLGQGTTFHVRLPMA